MDEKLSLFRSCGRKARHVFASINDTVGALLHRQPPIAEKVFEAFGTREDLDALALLQPIARLLPDQPRVAVNRRFGHRRCWNP